MCPAPTRPHYQISVLIVEDDEFNLEILSDMLALYGITPQMARSGLEALEKFPVEGVDLIFMDIKMPGIDGYETTKRLRQKGSISTIVALTASVDIEKKMLDSGFNDFLVKPLEIKDLERMLQKHFSHKQLRPAP